MVRCWIDCWTHRHQAPLKEHESCNFFVSSWTMHSLERSASHLFEPFAGYSLGQP